MKLSVVVIATILVLVNGSSVFKRYDQPEYTVEKKQPQDGSFEIRKYAAASWVSTTMEGSELSDEGKEFMKLFEYINGFNLKDEKIAMTIPVTTKFSSPPCIMCNRSYTMSFYIAKAFQSSPPAPVDKDVVIDKRPEFVAYVRTFPGFACERTYRKNAKALYEDLLRNGITNEMIMGDMFYGASYDSPIHIFKRRNEIWVIGAKKNATNNLLYFYPSE